MSCSIEQVSTDEARQFWLQQEDARIFLHPDVLEPLCEQVDWWLARWNSNPVCLWPVCHAFDGGVRPPELSAYVGPLWHDDALHRKTHRWWTMTSKVQAEFLEHLVDRYDSVGFELPPGTQDIRPFQWFAEEHAADCTLDIQCRHTIILDRPEPFDVERVMENLDQSRRRSVRAASDRYSLQSTTLSGEDAYGLYSSLLAAKGISDTARRREHELLTLMATAERGLGDVAACRGLGDAIAGFVLTLGRGKTRVQPLAVVSEAGRNTGAQAMLSVQSFIQAFQSGAERVDMSGGNGRVGAVDLHRYGGTTAMYFRIQMAQR